MTEDAVKSYIGEEVYCTATEQTVLLRGYRGNGLAQISHPERFQRGKYPNITHDCLLCNLRPLSQEATT
jgi:rRNA pseudouridine-1189 N-methylase Emg1 (Nep1/Mra1 family)